MFCTKDLHFSTATQSKHRFSGMCTSPRDHRLILAEFEANDGKSGSGISGTLEEIVSHGLESPKVYLIVSGVHSQNNSGWGRVTEIVQLMSIPDGVKEISEASFRDCMNLSRVTFSGSCSLKLIGNWAFH